MTTFFGTYSSQVRSTTAAAAASTSMLLQKMLTYW
jgi:hypothetical protein